MEFRILNTDFIDVNHIDVFKSVIWTDRYSSYGDFEISLPPTKEYIDMMQKDFYFWNNDSEHTMIIEDVRIISDIELGNQLLVTGRSLESILDRRIIWEQTNLNGNFQEGIKKLLDDAIINPEDVSRKIPNFIFEYSENEYITGLKINTQFTGKNLYESIKELCDSVDIGFKIILSEDNDFVFSLYSGTNRSYEQTDNPYVIFSQNFDNLINSNYYSSKRELKTIVLVAGEGEGTDRTTVPVTIESGSDSGLNRREGYRDARDLSSNNGEVPSEAYQRKLTERGESYLSENISITVFEGEVDSFNVFVYDRDFFIGDIIQIENEYGIEAISRIIEVIKSQNDEGYEIFPTFKTIE